VGSAEGVSVGFFVAVGVGYGVTIPQADKTIEKNKNIVTKELIFFIDSPVLGNSPLC